MAAPAKPAASAPKAKPSAAKPKAAAAAHPSYFEMIKEAIAALKDRTGSSSVAIAKYVEEKHGKTLPANFKKMLSVQLRGSVAKGNLVKVKNSYKLSDAAKKDSPKAKTVAAKAAKKPAKGAAKPKKKDAAKPKKKDAATPKKTAAAGTKRKAPEKKLVAKAKKSAAAKSKAKPKTVKSPAAKSARKIAG